MAAQSRGSVKVPGFVTTLSIERHRHPPRRLPKICARTEKRQRQCTPPSQSGHSGSRDDTPSSSAQCLVASGHGASAKTRWRTTATAATFPEAVRENEEVVPVNAVSTWVLPSGVTVGR